MIINYLIMLQSYSSNPPWNALKSETVPGWILDCSSRKKASDYLREDEGKQI